MVIMVIICVIHEVYAKAEKTIQCQAYNTTYQNQIHQQIWLTMEGVLWIKEKPKEADRQCISNIILKCVRAPTVALEKQ